MIYAALTAPSDTADDDACAHLDELTEILCATETPVPAEPRGSDGFAAAAELRWPRGHSRTYAYPVSSVYKSAADRLAIRQWCELALVEWPVPHAATTLPWATALAHHRQVHIIDLPGQPASATRTARDDTEPPGMRAFCPRSWTRPN